MILLTIVISNQFNSLLILNNKVVNHFQGAHKLLAYMKNALQEVVPGIPFEYQFLDQEFDKIYKSEIKLSRIVTVFTVLAIFIACIGLFGLSAYDTMQRTKEIGVRKVVGAQRTQLIRQFVAEHGLEVDESVQLPTPKKKKNTNNGPSLGKVEEIDLVGGDGTGDMGFSFSQTQEQVFPLTSSSILSSPHSPSTTPSRRIGNNPIV